MKLQHYADIFLIGLIIFVLPVRLNPTGDYGDASQISETFYPLKTFDSSPFITILLPN